MGTLGYQFEPQISEGFHNCEMMILDSQGAIKLERVYCSAYKKVRALQFPESVNIVTHVLLTINKTPSRHYLLRHRGFFHCEGRVRLPCGHPVILMILSNVKIKDRTNLNRK